MSSHSVDLIYYDNKMKVLITGGLGYIGSTIASALTDCGHIPLLIDDLSTGSREFARGRIFYEGDIADELLIDRICREHPDIALSVHCAALIDVNESIIDPSGYYQVNLAKSLSFVRSLMRNGVEKLVFSSSAAIYHAADGAMLTESAPIAPTSPYGWTKAFCEQMFSDIAASGALRVISLRYFNPIGADPLMRTGPRTIEATHVLGRLIEARSKSLPFTITGTNYATHDGTGLRDYIHVWDLALAHVKAATEFDNVVNSQRPCLAINLGRGEPVSVRELVAIFNQVSPLQVEIVDGPRRPGDVTGGFASCELAYQTLTWRTLYSISDAIRDSLKWLEHRAKLNIEST